VVDFIEIIERVKDIVSIRYTGAVYDKDVASELGMSARTLRVYKSANIIPYENICVFCSKHNISIDWMLFGVDFKPKKLEN
jgi:hypothetical protein